MEYLFLVKKNLAFKAIASKSPPNETSEIIARVCRDSLTGVKKTKFKHLNWLYSMYHESGSIPWSR